MKNEILKERKKHDTNSLILFLQQRMRTLA